ncbi:MAG: YybH family protein [Bryobacteraceae bacterium]
MPSQLVWFLALFLAVMAQRAEAPPMADSNTDPYANDRKLLLKIFHEVESSINSQNLDRMVKQMDQSATVVWSNGEVSRGPAEVLAYYDRMVKGNDRILIKYMTSAKLTGHARFLGNGDVAIADGTMEDEYFPIVRGPFRLSSKWTTTVAKINGEWKIVALHLSANVFNNVLLDEAKSALMYTGGGGLVVGGLIGWFAGRRRKRA